MNEEDSAISRERCVTGIAGLDNILTGGVPRGNTILITGSCGTGKTTMSLEFLVRGALNNEKTLYISVTEASDKLLNNMILYEFFDKKLVDDKKMIFIDLPDVYEELKLKKLQFTLDDIDILVNDIIKTAKDLDIKRLVIDSITSICYRLHGEEEIREFILRLAKGLSDLNCTTFLISEILMSAKGGYSQYGVEEAITDGIVVLGNLERKGDLLRTLQVVKMRGTTHSRAKYVLDLTSIGVLMVPLLKGAGTTASGGA